MRDLAIITLNYNGSEDTIECLESLSKCSGQYTYNVFVLDNASNADEKDKLCDWIQNQEGYRTISVEEFKKQEKISDNCLIISDENLGFAKGNNVVIEKIYSMYRYVLLLNNDTVVTHDFIQKMVDFLDSDEETGFASCRINYYYENETMWNCGGCLKPWGVRRYYTQSEIESAGDLIDTEFITGCALFIRSSIVFKYGMLTNQFFFGEEDFNFCWRMKRAGIKGKCLTSPLVLHKVSKSSDKVGEKAGKLAGYYVVRTVDMRQFYPFPLWIIWKRIIVFLMGLKWRRMGFSAKTVKKMKKAIHYYSKNECITKADIFDVWSI